MQRFRRMRSLQKFASVYSSVYNHFNQERSLASRDTFNLTRTAALAEWREIFFRIGSRFWRQTETGSNSSDSTAVSLVSNECNGLTKAHGLTRPPQESSCRIGVPKCRQSKIDQLAS